jgi:hemerythrin-like domain-containing protein
MSQLIDQLEDEHSQLLDMLNTISMLGAKDAGHLILLARDGLLEHLKREDEELYPALHERAKKDENLKETLDVYANDMAEISKTAIAFFEKYGDDPAQDGFVDDLENLSKALNSRIQREEKFLYTEYEKLLR